MSSSCILARCDRNVLSDSNGISYNQLVPLAVFQWTEIMFRERDVSLCVSLCCARARIAKSRKLSRLVSRVILPLENSH